MKNNNSKYMSQTHRVSGVFSLLIIGLVGFLMLNRSAEMQTKSAAAENLAAQSPDTALLLGKLAYQRTQFFTSGLGNTYIGFINANGTSGGGVPPGDDLLPSFVQPDWSPDGSKLVYSRNANSGSDLYVINADGSNQINLTKTFSSVIESNPSWSATNKIAYERDNQIWTMNADGSNQMQFSAISQPMPIRPAWSPDGSKLAFTSSGEIYVINADGTNERRVTNNSTIDASPAWSPDGSKIVYGKGTTGIAVINLDGTNERNLTNGTNDGQPSWSSDNTKIAFGRYGADVNGIYIMNIDGSNQLNLIADNSVSPNITSSGNPAWQPVAPPLNPFTVRGRVTLNGTGLANVVVNLSNSTQPAITTDTLGNYQIGELTGGGNYTVTPSLSGYVFNPPSITFNNLNADETANFVAAVNCSTQNCAANGRIAFVRGAETSNAEIYTMRPDGSNQINITNNPANDNYPSYAPDGGKIVFASYRDSGQFQIYTMNADGSGVIRLTNNTSRDYYPSYSPNGEKIVFISGRDGNDEIYLMNADGTNQVRLTNFKNSGAIPRITPIPSFSPDGSKIAYSGSLSSGQTTIFTMNADGTNPVQLINPVFAEQYAPSYSPDGRKIVYVYISGTSTTVYMMNADSSNQQAITSEAAGQFRHPSYSPDGTKIIFSRPFNFSASIQILDSSGLKDIAVGTSPSWQPIRRRDQTRTPFDFDGDGRADVAVFRPSNGVWYQLRSQNNAFNAFQFGQSGDLPALADFDGDGKADLAVFRDNLPGGNAAFFITNSSDNSFRPVPFGLTGDVPVVGDWDGDGIADLAVYRSASTAGGQSYFIYRASSIPNAGFTVNPWGTLGDRPVMGDFDGDGKLDAAVYRPSSGAWYIIQSSNAQVVSALFGVATDIPVPADYDGDGKANLAVFRPSNGTWYIARPTGTPAQNFDAVQFGTAGDLPVAADYDGDGKADVAVFRPSNGSWYLNRSTAGFTGVQFGTSEDRPIPSAFVR